MNGVFSLIRGRYFKFTGHSLLDMFIGVLHAYDTLSTGLNMNDIQKQKQIICVFNKYRLILFR